MLLGIKTKGNVITNLFLCNIFFYYIFLNLFINYNFYIMTFVNP